MKWYLLYLYFYRAIGWIAPCRSLGASDEAGFRPSSKDFYWHVLPQSKKIMVSDNLNTHNVSSFYESFDPETARHLSRKVELHHTPKHGSWLNIAEIKLSALSIGCLKEWTPSMNMLNSDLSAWQTFRNVHHNKVNWNFTTADARTKLISSYPNF